MIDRVNVLSVDEQRFQFQIMCVFCISTENSYYPLECSKVQDEAVV